MKGTVPSTTGPGGPGPPDNGRSVRARALAIRHAEPDVEAKAAHDSTPRSVGALGRPRAEHYAHRDHNFAAAPSATFLAGDPPRRSPEEVARRLRTLIDALAPSLGLDPSRVQLTLSPYIGSQNAASSRDTITITGSADPASIDARLLLVHELVHARQHANRTRPESAVPNLSAAESEATGLVAAVREGRELWVPRQTLPDGHVARDTGAVGTTPTTTNPIETATTPDVAGLERKLDQLVAVNHSGDQRLIEGQLDHPWTQTHSGMVENCLRILSTMPFVVARAVVRRIDQPVRLRLAMLDDDHHAEFPEACVAVLSALTAKELGLLSSQVVGEVPYRGATAAFHGVEPDRLSTIARRSLLGALRKLSVTTLTELEHSNRREVFRSLLGSSPDFETDEADLARAIGEEEQRFSATPAGGDKTVETMRRILANPNAVTARMALAALKTPLDVASPGVSKKPQDEPDQVTLARLQSAIPAQAAGRPGTNAPPPPLASMVALVARLDKEGMIDKILDALPEEDRYGDTYRDVVKKMLAARDSPLNLARATSLLSYGFFDWLISDSEARYAYLLVRSCSIEAQDAWRALDDGKWLHRLEDNLPSDVMSSGEYTGVGSEYKPDGGFDLGIPEKLLKGYAEQKFLARWEKHSTEAVAEEIVRELIGLDPKGNPKPWLTDPKSPLHETALRTAIVRRIDARLKLDDIIEALPDDYLFGDDGRVELVTLNATRDPVHLIEQARNLVPSGFFDWLFFGWITFTERRAWIAALALSGLSPTDQERLKKDDPDLVDAVHGGLSPEMASKLPTALAAGRDPRLPTLQSIRERLGDPRLWTAKMVIELRSLLDLAYAADDRKWVFEKSHDLRADKRPGLEVIVHDFHLYSERPPENKVWHPDVTKHRWIPVLGRKLGVIGHALGILVYDLFAGSIDPWGKTMHLKGFDLGDAPTLLGALGTDVKGVDLAESKGDVNQVNVEATFESGFIVNVDLKDLEIAGVNIERPGKSFRSGPISVKGLKATAGFSDRHYNDPAYIGVTLGSLAVHDLVLIDPGLPFSMAWAIVQLAMQALSFRASQDASFDPVAKIGQKLPEGVSAIPIPIFGPLFQLLSNIVSIKGAIPGDFTLLDYALIPAKLPFGVTTLADYAFPTPAPLTYLWGLASDGVLRPPYSAAQRIKDSMGMLRAFNVTFQELKVEGISIGSGQQIQSLTLTDVNLSIGQSLPAYLNTALATLKAAQAKLPRDSQQYKDLDARIAALRVQIESVEASPHLAELRRKRAHEPDKLSKADKQELALADEKSQDEGRLAELEGKDRWHPGSLTEHERGQLVELSKKLRSDVGITAEVGSITLGPLSGTVQAAGVSLEGIHTTLRIPNVGLLPLVSSMAYLDDKSLAEEFIKGGPRIPTVAELAKSSQFSLSIDSTTVLKTDPLQPAVVIRATRVPDANEIQKQIAALPTIKGNEPIRARLEGALGKVKELNLAQTAFDSLVATQEARKVHLSDADNKELADAKEKVLQLTDDAKRLLGIEIGGIKFGRITGELDPSGTLTATIHDAEITGLKGPGFAVTEVAGSVKVGVGFAGVTARPDQLKGAALAGQLRPSFELKGVRASGISFAKGEIKAATIGQLAGSVQATKDGFAIPDLTLDQLEIDGVDAVSIGKDGDGLTGDVVTLRGLRLNAEVGLTKTAAGTKVSKAIIHSLSIAALGGEHIVYDMPQEKGSIHAELIGGEIHDISATEVVFDEGSEGFGLASGSAEVGSFADIRYAVAIGALKSRTTVKGTLTTSKEALTGKRPTIKATYARAGGRQFSLLLQDLEALGTEISTPDGRVVIRKVKVGAKLDGSDAGIKAGATLSDLTVGPISWKVGPGRLSGSGPIVAKTVTVGAVRTPDVAAQGKRPAKPAAWSVTDIFITGLEGSDLRYTAPPIELHLGRDDKPAAPGERPLKVGRIHLQPAQGKIEVEDLSVDFGGSLKSSLNVTGSGHAEFQSFSMDLSRDDHVVATARGAAAQVTVSGDYSGTVTVGGLKGATIDVGPDTIRIGGTDPNDPTGLQIDQVSLTSLKVTSGSGGHKFTLQTQKDGRVDLLGIHAKVRIDKFKPGEKHKGPSPFKQLAVERLLIDQILLTALQIDLPDDDLTIVVPARSFSDPPTIRGLDLYGGVDKDKVLHPEFLVNLETFATEGGVSVTDITLPMSVALKDKFKGDVTLSTKASKIDFLSAGGVRIDVANPLLTMEKNAELGTSGTVRVGKLGADRLTFADGRLDVTNPFLENLLYSQGPVWFLVKSAKMSQLSYTTGPAGELDIPSLDIEEASVWLKLDQLIPKPTAAEEEAAKTAKAAGVTVPPAFDIEALRPIADEVGGSVSVVMYVSADAKGWKDFRIGSEKEPLKIPIKNGAVDIPTLERNLYGKVKATDIGSGLRVRPWIATHVAKDPILRLKGSSLELGVYWLDPIGYRAAHKEEQIEDTWQKILRWDLKAPDFTKAQASQFTLWAAMFELHKSVAPTDPEKRKEEEDETAAMINSIELRNLDVDLSVKNTSPLLIKITSKAANGTIELSPDAVQHLRVTGGIPAVEPLDEDVRPGKNPAELKIQLDALLVGKVDLLIGPNKLSTGNIKIEKLADASVSFKDLKTPVSFFATITKAHASDIRWYRAVK